MRKQTWKTYAFWILLSEAVGALAGFLTREGTRLYSEAMEKPPLSPPAIVFPIVWVILYALMGIGAARVSLAHRSRMRSSALTLFGAQLAVNFFWSILFFNFRLFGFSFVWLIALWILILVTILQYRKISPTAAYLQIPYAVWVAFAGYLNAGIWWLNR